VKIYEYIQAGSVSEVDRVHSSLSSVSCQDLSHQWMSNRDLHGQFLRWQRKRFARTESRVIVPKDVDVIIYSYCLQINIYTDSCDHVGSKNTSKHMKGIKEK
jgi:hypothetical protein